VARSSSRRSSRCPAWGRLVVNAIYQRGLHDDQGAILLLTSAAVLVNLALDLLYHLIDRRILHA
jgi:ABC-type dipeptide/oligopeptide/nickel transport system permease component